ncbi:MAG: ABC transporter transmembrane domain-containing protein, partial [Planctomycetota bacterium]
MLSGRDALANETTVARYTDQPARMPEEVREALERAWGGRPVELYALADLDASMRLARTWVALGPEHVALAAEREGERVPEVASFERSRVTGTRTAPGLSCNVTTILGDAGEAPLAVLRYTHRQRRAIENITFVLEQGLEGRRVPGVDADEVYAGAVAEPVRSAQASVNVNKLSVLWRLLGYLRPYRRRVAIGLGAAAVMTSLALVPPYLTGYLIDKVFRPYQAGTLAHAEARRAAWIVLAVIAGIYLLREACGWVRLRTMSILGEDVARDLRTEVYEHLQELSLGYYSRMKTGSIISRVTSDTDRLWHFIALGVVEVSLASVMLVGLATVLILLDWRLGLVMVVPVPLLLGALVRHSGVMRRIFLRAWRKWSGLTGLVADSVGGVRVVKAFHQEERQKARFNATNDDAAAEFRKIHVVWTGFWPRLMIAFRGLIIVVWALAIPLVLALDVSGPGALSIGTFVSFLLYMGMFLYPIDVIGQMTHMVNRATSSAHRIFEVLDTRPEIAEPPEPVRVDQLKGRV